MLISRVLTAVVLLPLVLAAIMLAPPLVFSACVVLVLMGVAWEWGGCSSPLRAYRISMPLALAAVMAGTYVFHVTGSWLLISGLLVWFLCPLWLAAKTRLHPVIKAAAGVIVIASAGVALGQLKAAEVSGWLVLAVFLLVWAADVGAYAAGRLLGRHKMAPVISPGKTWEGAAGGLALCLAVAVAIQMILPVYGSLLQWLALAALVFVFSVLGDLAESLLKRQAGVKDSGSLLPGHGGLFDRLDSLLAAAPVFWLAAEVAGFPGIAYPGN